jgi:uncharacterized cupin superfamily protein
MWRAQALGTMTNTMYVICHTSLPRTSHPSGCRSLCAAGRARGLTQFEAWIHELDAGAASVPCTHAAEQALLVLAGGGKLMLAGAPHRFNAPCTLIVPAGVEHQIVNHGAQTLQYVAVLAALPGPAGASDVTTP